MKKLDTVTTYRDGLGSEAQPTNFDYDEMGRAIQTVFPDTTRETSQYEFGQLDIWKTRKGQTKRIEYDARGREASHTWDDGAASGINREWDLATRMTKIWNSFSIIDYKYDDAGQVWWERNHITGSGGPVQTTYCRYPSGEVSRLIYPNCGGLTVQRNYTERGLLFMAAP